MRMRWSIAASLAVAAGALAVPASAAAAPIDDFNTPGILAFSTQPSLSNESFGTQTGEPAAASGCPAMGHTGWWRIEGTGQQITISTAGSNFNTVLAAYDAPGAPSAGNRIACNDTLGSNFATIVFGSVRGRSYLIQVGGNPTSTFGVLVLSASAPRPGNDDRATALAVPPNESRSVDSTGASSEPGEVLACDADRYAATVWFRFTAPAVGDVAFTASGNFPTAPNPGDTVMAVYRASDGAPLGCNDDAGAGAGGSRVAFRAPPGEYLVQVGGHEFGLGNAGEGVVNLRVDYAEDLDLDRDGSPRPADCNDANPAINPSAIDVFDDGVDQDCSGADAANPDRDGDGFPRPADCDDTNRGIHPGAVDVPGDGINQDCAGGDAPYPVLQSGITGFFQVFRSYTKVTDFLVRRLQAGTRVTVTCDGRGCPFKRRARNVRRARERLPLIALLRGAKLRRGVRLTVQVTKPLTIGLVTTWEMRSRKAPLRIDRCLRPGARRPGRCPR
jgi:putative metal-binding protein